MDVEKTMAFILDMQAKNEAALARLEASAQGHEERITKLEASVATVTDLIGRLAQAETRLVERVDTGFQELRDLQANTEYKLNVLIDTVDKLVRRNGHKE